jgi:hypothetical protein
MKERIARRPVAIPRMREQLLLVVTCLPVAVLAVIICLRSTLSFVELLVATPIFYLLTERGLERGYATAATQDAPAGVILDSLARSWLRVIVLVSPVLGLTLVGAFVVTVFAAAGGAVAFGRMAPSLISIRHGIKPRRDGLVLLRAAPAAGRLLGPRPIVFYRPIARASLRSE